MGESGQGGGLWGVRVDGNGEFEVFMKIQKFKKKYFFFFGGGGSGPGGGGGVGLGVRLDVKGEVKFL